MSSSAYTGSGSGSANSTSTSSSAGTNQTSGSSSTGNTANSGEKRLTDQEVKQLTDSANAAKKKRGRPTS